MKTNRSAVWPLGLAFILQGLFMILPSRLDSQAPRVKTGEIKENQEYKSGMGLFSITVPAAGNPSIRTYKVRESQLKDDNFDYEEVLFSITDFGQAYGAGVRRIPPLVQAQMAKEDQKQVLSNLADKALFQWRDDYAAPPRFVDDSAIDTQFGPGLLRVYLARRSSLLVTKTADSDQAEHFDAYIGVLVVRKGDLFICATAEDDFMQQQKSHRPPVSAESTGDDFDPKPLEKELQRFFATMRVNLKG
jgi:hypothetical protein